MAYTKQTWADLPSKTTPINASRLGHIEDGIFNAAATADTAASNASSAISGLADKVDKVEGKGLSTNDYDNTAKGIVDTVTTNLATKVNKSDVARVEDGTSPSATINEGKQFYHNGILYTATQDIATTDTITPNTNCRVSDSVTEQIADRMTYADNGVLGAKNLLPVTLSKVITGNNSGTWSNNVYSYNGIDYTLTAKNGYVTKINVNGTATDLSILKLCNGIKSLVGGRYILSGCPSGGSTSTYYLQGYRVESADGQSGSVQDTGNGVAFDYLNTVENDNFSILVLKNKTVNADYYPMLRLATDTDPTYQPYAETNRELTVNKCDNTVIAPTENGSTASQAYAVGSHFIRNGAFCTVTTAISSGESLVGSSKFTSGDVGNCLPKHDTFSKTLDSSGKAQITNLTNRLVFLIFGRIVEGGAVIIQFYRNTAGATSARFLDSNGELLAEGTQVTGDYYYYDI